MSGIGECCVLVRKVALSFFPEVKGMCCFLVAWEKIQPTLESHK